MVGLIHNILFDMVDQLAGSQKTQDIRAAAGIAPDAEFRIDENYDDAEFRRVVAAACEQLNLTQEQVEAAYAKAFYEDSKKRWPTWFAISKNAREFLKRQPTIHNGFATGVSDPDARPIIRDKFRQEERDDRLIVHYRSPNKLCGVFVNLAQQILAHYDETATIEHPNCIKRGDDACEIHVIWS